jgi:hypothetical protein
MDREGVSVRKLGYTFPGLQYASLRSILDRRRSTSATRLPAARLLQADLSLFGEPAVNPAMADSGLTSKYIRVVPERPQLSCW